MTAIVLGLVALSVVAVSAARDARTTAADVRQSTRIWNAYQQARYSVAQEALLTKDFTPLEPDVLEYKWYAKGVGPIREESVSGGSDRTVLLSYQPG